MILAAICLPISLVVRPTPRISAYSSVTTESQCGLVVQEPPPKSVTISLDNGASKNSSPCSGNKSKDIYRSWIAELTLGFEGSVEMRSWDKVGMVPEDVQRSDGDPKEGSSWEDTILEAVPPCC